MEDSIMDFSGFSVNPIMDFSGFQPHSDSECFRPSFSSTKTANELNILLPPAPPVYFNNDMEMVSFINDTQMVSVNNDTQMVSTNNTRDLEGDSHFSDSISALSDPSMNDNILEIASCVEDTEGDSDDEPSMGEIIPVPPTAIEDVSDDEEPSIDNIPIPPQYVAPEDHLWPTYVILQGVSNRGRDILVCSRGYEHSTQSNKPAKSGKLSFRCVHRNPKGAPGCINCTAVFLPDRFTKAGVKKDPRGPKRKPHICKPKYNAEIVRMLRFHLKRKGFKNMFTEAMEIVHEERPLVILEPEEHLYTNLPGDKQLAAQMNYYRRPARPQDVGGNDLFFELDLNNTPEGFLQADIQLPTARHLILATPHQLDYLSKAITWYIDGTFSIVREPFVQMFSVHVFVRKGTFRIQIPVAFVIMSRRTKEDYKKVFQSLLEVLPQQPKVKKVVLDFERAVWSTLRSMMELEEFPRVQLKGCFFHFTQALYRRIGLIGLANQYKHDKPTRDICRQMMALAFLPKEYVSEAFEHLKERCISSGIANLKKFAMYMEKNWIEGWFTPKDWVRFLELVRTNNHTEGWHRGLNQRFKRKRVRFYRLINGLYKEATNARSQAHQVNKGLLTCYMSPRNRERNAYLDAQWDQLKKEEICIKTFLENVSKKVSPQATMLPHSRIDLDVDDLENINYENVV